MQILLRLDFSAQLSYNLFMPEWLGKTIGRVRIDKLLVRGGIAEVYLGTHLTLERLVAVKLLHNSVEEEPGLLERFQREAKAVASLRHPNIVQIYDLDTTAGHPYIVMEYLRGPTLTTYLRHQHERKKRLRSDKVAGLLKGLTSALDYAHEQGVIHRDIKPGNIVLHNKMDEIPLDQPLPDDVEPIVTDFGLVRLVNTVSHTASSIAGGTPAYMSPEQARDDLVDHRTDIYSLGVVLYEMLAGRVPFEADSAVAVLHMHIHTRPPAIPGISPKLQAVLDRALQKNPDDRYTSSQEMAIDFYQAIGITTPPDISRRPSPVSHVPIEAPAPTEPKSLPKLEPRAEAAPRPKPARRWAWIAIGLFSLVCLALLAIGALRLLPGFLTPNVTLSPVIPNTAVSPLPSEMPNLPESKGMVEVAAGTYEVGLSAVDEYHIAPKKVSLNAFWIDSYQTTNAQYEKYIAETGSPPPEIWPGEEDHPVRGTTWDQALAYCTWMKKRLPTEAEWEAAGRGPGAPPPLYPWGDDATAGGQIASLPDQNTYPVGTLSFNQSPFGVFDMVGNIWEWVGEPYTDDQEAYRVLRGGRYGLPVLDLAYRLKVPAGDTRYVRYAGFRCAADQVR
jgi:serine/threonine-protein kinase